MNTLEHVTKKEKPKKTQPVTVDIKTDRSASDQLYSQDSFKVPVYDDPYVLCSKTIQDELSKNDVYKMYRSRLEQMYQRLSVGRDQLNALVADIHCVANDLVIKKKTFAERLDYLNHSKANYKALHDEYSSYVEQERETLEKHYELKQKYRNEHGLAPMLSAIEQFAIDNKARIDQVFNERFPHYNYEASPQAKIQKEIIRNTLIEELFNDEQNKPRY